MKAGAIDLYQVTSTFTGMYFSTNKVDVDGRQLRCVADYHVVPAPWGVRIVLNREIEGRSIRITFDPQLSKASDEPPIASVWRYNAGFGWRRFATRRSRAKCGLVLRGSGFSGLCPWNQGLTRGYGGSFSPRDYVECSAFPGNRTKQLLDTHDECFRLLWIWNFKILSGRSLSFERAWLRRT